MKTLGLFAAGILVGAVALLVFDFGREDNTATAVGGSDEQLEAFRREVDARLSSIEQELRRQCAAGEIADDDPRWLVNRPHSKWYAALRER